MKVRARIVPNSRQESILPGDPWRIRVNAPAREGKANHRAIELLAAHLGVAPGRVRLIRGAASKDKTFHIT